jgi:hypothetical protein
MKLIYENKPFKDIAEVYTGKELHPIDLIKGH